MGDVDEDTEVAGVGNSRIVVDVIAMVENVIKGG